MDVNVSGTAAQVTEALTDLAEMRDGAGNDDGVLTVTDNGTVEASVAVAEAMTADDGNFYTNYTLRDTAAALDAADSDTLARSQGVTVTTGDYTDSAAVLAIENFGSTTVEAIVDDADVLAGRCSLH